MLLMYCVGHGKSRIADPWSDILNQMELSRALVDKSWNQSIVNRTKRITVLRERLSTLKGETTRFQQLTVDQKLQNQAMEVRLKHIKQYTQQKLALPRNQVMDSMAIDAE